MSENPLPTEHLPAEREMPEVVERQHRALAEIPLLSDFMDAMPNMVVILNKTRQTVFHNRRLEEKLVPEQVASVLGLRPGEFLGCAHAAAAAGGCGTTRFCRVCGGAKATVEALKGNCAVEECRIITNRPDRVHDLRVWATPLRTREGDFIIYAIMDISNEKRREALERIFFHDVLNTAGAVQGAAELLGEAAGAKETEQCRKIILSSSGRLIDEIQSQREINAAERGELSTKNGDVHSRGLLEDLAELYENHEVAKGKEIQVAMDAEALVLHTDRSLLSRVVGNMLKNGLEASPIGAVVTLGCAREGGDAVFRVHNPAVMPEKVQLQVFQRSFSTKGGSGRGLGTFSMKLLGEGYLKGKVWFESSDPAGTTFFIRLPLKKAS